MWETLVGSWDAKATVATCSAIVAIGALVVGIWNYVSNNRWRRREYVDARFSDFFCDRDVKRALQMLDWNLRDIELFPDEKTYSGRMFLVSDDLVAASLIHHEVNGRPMYTVEMMMIRDIFDQFLSKLGAFSIMLDQKVITLRSATAYLGYWVALITNAPNRKTGCRQKPDSFHRNLILYIHAYGFDDVIRLVDKIPLAQGGKRIRLSNNTYRAKLEELQDECAQGLWRDKTEEALNAARDRRMNLTKKGSVQNLSHFWSVAHSG